MTCDISYRLGCCFTVLFTVIVYESAKYVCIVGNALSASSYQDACIPVVNTVLDKCLYGDKVVVSKVLDSGRNGEYPAKSNHDAVLRKFVSSHYAVSLFRACKRE